MTLIFTTTTLKHALGTVIGVVNPRSPLAIQQCVLLTCEPDEPLTIRATNAVFGVTQATGCDCKSPASFAVNAKQLYDFVSLLGEGAVISCKHDPKNQTVEFSHLKHIAKFRTYPADEFPASLAIVETHSFEVDFDEFQRALKQGSIAVMESKGNFAQSSIALSIKDGAMMITTYDHTRIASANGIKVENVPDGEFLIPRVTADYLRKLPASDEPVRIGFNDTAMRIQAGTVVVQTSRTAGTLGFNPETIPEIFARNIEISLSDFQRAVNVVSVLMTGDELKKSLDIQAKNGKMTIQPKFAPDIDLSTSEIECEHGDEPYHAILSVQQLKDYFSVVSGETIYLRTKGENQIISLDTDEQKNFGYYIAPIVVKEAA